MTKARRKPKPPARTKRKIGAGKVAAAMLPLALAVAPAAVNRAKKTTAPSTTTATHGAARPIAFIPGCKLPSDPIDWTPDRCAVHGGRQRGKRYGQGAGEPCEEQLLRHRHPRCHYL